VAEQIPADLRHEFFGSQQPAMQQNMRLAAAWHALSRRWLIWQHVTVDDHGSGTGSSRDSGGEQPRETPADDHHVPLMGADHRTDVLLHCTRSAAAQLHRISIKDVTRCLNPGYGTNARLTGIMVTVSPT
jgi:hypothetical protein